MMDHPDALPESVHYCGRTFTASDLATIRRIISTEATRTAISRAVCSALGWRKPDGGLKEVSCRVALLRMQDHGLIRLPAPRCQIPRYSPSQFTAASDPQPRIVGSRGDLQAVHLQRITTRAQSRLWNDLLARYHYLGHQPLAGAQLRYLAYDGERLLAACGFGASAWTVQARDCFIGWTPAQRQAHLHLVVNMARFLILPWVQLANLASSLLSLVARRLPEDWETVYRYRPVLLETFVDERFRGSCYRGANWIGVGWTRGTGKDHHKPRRRRRNALRKQVFLFPLHRHFRQILLGERAS